MLKKTEAEASVFLMKRKKTACSPIRRRRCLVSPRLSAAKRAKQRTKNQTSAARSAIKFFWFLFFQEKERPPGEGK